MSGDYNFDHRAFYDPASGKRVPIRSAVGQAQFFLGIVAERITAPNEQLLLCRFASTIHRYSDERELRQLRQLAWHLDQHRFEERHGYVNPVVGQEVEREIILRQAMDCAAGYDLTPTMRLLAEYERNGPVFSQPERNLLLRSAFCLGEQGQTRALAEAFIEKQCSSRSLADICRKIEQVELDWAELKNPDGQHYEETMAPGFRMSLKNCTDPMAHYPPFAYYPRLELPEDSVVLQNGVVLFPDQEGWWRSGMQKVDQTFTAPHFYKADGERTFTISDQEYEPIIGRITFASGEKMEFVEAEDYLEAIREELPYQATTGFRCETLTDAPEVRKAVDDMLYDLYGEENPRTLEDYGSTGTMMGGMV